jgi:hypothetical protein
MRKHTLLTLLATSCAVLFVFGNNAKALTLGDENDLGQVLFGIPSGDAFRTSYVNHLIGMALDSTDTALGQTFHRSLQDPTGGVYPPAVFSHNGKTTTVDLGAGGFTYLFAKYDGKNAGSEVWYVGGQTGVIDIPAEGLLGQNYGLSGWTLFGGTPTTPDSGTTAALLGLGLASLAGLRARFGRS